MKKLGSSTFMLEYLVPVRHYCVCAALFYNQGIICTKGSLSINLNSGVQQDRQQLYRCLCNTTKNRQELIWLSHILFYFLEGYPYNLDFDYGALGQLQHFSINNLGDPFIESNYGVHSRQFEVGVLDWFARLWDLEKDKYWGYITNCGTEGNLHGILVG